MVKRETDDYCGMGNRDGYQEEVLWHVITKVLRMIIIIRDDRECTNGTTWFPRFSESWDFEYETGDRAIVLKDLNGFAGSQSCNDFG